MPRFENSHHRLVESNGQLPFDGNVCCAGRRYGGDNGRYSEHGYFYFIFGASEIGYFFPFSDNTLLKQGQ